MASRREEEDWWDDGRERRKPPVAKLGVWRTLGLVIGGLILMASLGQFLIVLTTAAKMDGGRGAGYFCAWLCELSIGVAFALPGALRLMGFGRRPPDPYD